MKVLMLNTFDEVGGAAKAAFRLQKGVRKLGVDSRLLVHFKSGDDAEVVCNNTPWRRTARSLKLYLGLLPVLRYPRRPENNFTPALLPDSLVAEVGGIKPDIIHLHWLGAGFCRVETLGKLNKPLLWTLHDSWGFTGGCHVPFECTRYREQCGSCPVLGSSRGNDLSRWTWKRKAKAWRDLDLTVVAPSHWLADCARSSALFRDIRVEVIPNGLDLTRFKPMDKRFARELLNLPLDRKIILFGAVGGASDPNKGFQLLQPALQRVSRKLPKAMTVIFGSSAPSELPDLGMEAAYLGPLRDESSLVAAYSAADLFVSPSLLENLPNAIMESMACGTPCVAFRQGGSPELIEHGVSGYLAQPYEIDDLAQGIGWVLEDLPRHAELSGKSRLKMEAEFAIPLVARRYAELYREVLT
jgi:glycosyltransferase involved in cell wall biosynthesis